MSNLFENAGHSSEHQRLTYKSESVLFIPRKFILWRWNLGHVARTHQPTDQPTDRPMVGGVSYRENMRKQLPQLMLWGVQCTFTLNKIHEDFQFVFLRFSCLFFFHVDVFNSSNRYRVMLRRECEHLSAWRSVSSSACQKHNVWAFYLGVLSFVYSAIFIVYFTILLFIQKFCKLANQFYTIALFDARTL